MTKLKLSRLILPFISTHQLSNPLPLIKYFRLGENKRCFFIKRVNFRTSLLVSFRSGCWPIVLAGVHGWQADHAGLRHAHGLQRRAKVPRFQLHLRRRARLHPDFEPRLHHHLAFPLGSVRLENRSVD